MLKGLKTMVNHPQFTSNQIDQKVDLNQKFKKYCFSEHFDIREIKDIELWKLLSEMIEEKNPSTSEQFDSVVLEVLLNRS